MNGTTWTQVAAGEGTGANTAITFRPVSAKYLKITQTAAPTAAPPWSITQLRIFEVPGAKPAAR